MRNELAPCLVEIIRVVEIISHVSRHEIRVGLFGSNRAQDMWESCLVTEARLLFYPVYVDFLYMPLSNG